MATRFIAVQRVRRVGRRDAQHLPPRPDV